MWQELLAVLQKITANYQQLLALSQKKRAVLVMVKLDALEAIVQQEQSLAAAIQQSETKRQAILHELARSDKGIRPDTKLRELYAHCPAPEIARQLQQLHNDLENVIQAVQEARDNNQILINSALSAVNYRLNQLGSSAVEPTYGAAGQEKVSHQKKFDFHA